MPRVTNSRRPGCLALADARQDDEHSFVPVVGRPWSVNARAQQAPALGGRLPFAFTQGAINVDFAGFHELAKQSRRGVEMTGEVSTAQGEALAWQVGIWDRISGLYWAEIDSRFAPVVDGTIARAALRPGERVLDL